MPSHSYSVAPGAAPNKRMDSFYNLDYPLNIDTQLAVLTNVSKLEEHSNNVLKFKITDLKLSNLVLTIANDKPLSLSNFVTVLDTYNFVYSVPKLFSGISVKFVYENVTVTGIFFKSGKIVLVGIKKVSPTVVTKIIKTIAYLLAQSNQVNPSLKIVVSNKVYSYSIDKQNFPNSLVDLYNAIKGQYLQYLEYNPSCFPGLTLRIPNCSAVFLLFNSRKCILTGGKDSALSDEVFYNALCYLQEIIKYANANLAN